MAARVKSGSFWHVGMGAVGGGPAAEVSPRVVSRLPWSRAECKNEECHLIIITHNFQSNDYG